MPTRRGYCPRDPALPVMLAVPLPALRVCLSPRQHGAQSLQLPLHAGTRPSASQACDRASLQLTSESEAQKCDLFVPEDYSHAH